MPARTPQEEVAYVAERLSGMERILAKEGRVVEAADLMRLAGILEAIVWPSPPALDKESLGTLLTTIFREEQARIYGVRNSAPDLTERGVDLWNSVAERFARAVQVPESEAVRALRELVRLEDEDVEDDAGADRNHGETLEAWKVARRVLAGQPEEPPLSVDRRLLEAASPRLDELLSICEALATERREGEPIIDGVCRLLAELEERREAQSSVPLPSALRNLVKAAMRYLGPDRPEKPPGYRELLNAIADAMNALKARHAADDPEVANCIAFLEHCRQTHVDWKAWIEAHPEEAQAPVPQVTTAGSPAEHQECIVGYDRVLDLIGTLRSRREAGGVDVRAALNVANELCAEGQISQDVASTLADRLTAALRGAREGKAPDAEKVRRVIAEIRRRDEPLPGAEGHGRTIFACWADDLESALSWAARLADPAPENPVAGGGPVCECTHTLAQHNWRNARGACYVDTCTCCGFELDESSIALAPEPAATEAEQLRCDLCEKPTNSGGYVCAECASRVVPLAPYESWLLDRLASLGLEIEPPRAIAAIVHSWVAARTREHAACGLTPEAFIAAALDRAESTKGDPCAEAGRHVCGPRAEKEGEQ